MKPPQATRSWGFRILLVFLYCQLNCGIHARTGPLKVYRKGVTRELRVGGGWTSWFNIDHPHDLGDFETIREIRRTFGRGCDGLPCNRPLAIKVMSRDGQSPKEESNDVKIDVLVGLRCYNENQYVRPCADYMVRFYCPRMGRRCRRAQNAEYKRRKAEKLYRATKSSRADPLWNKITKRENAVNREADMKRLPT